MKNNLFYYATSELSQDAVICYCANAFNGESSELKGMAERFIRLLLKKGSVDTTEIASVDVVRQFSRKIPDGKENIVVKIDVLLIVNGHIAVIIEDKTFSGHHDDQINRYKKGLLAQNENGITLPVRKDYVSAPEETVFKIDKIVCVYFKTGEYYPNDEEIENRKDVVGIHREDMLDLLKDYTKYSEILEQYHAALTELNEWYKNIEALYNSENYADALKEPYGQLVCARDLFKGKMTEPYQEQDIIITNGSSYGRPYTWIWLWGEKNKDWFGYRIDSKGDDKCSISFKQYRWYSKKETAPEEIEEIKRQKREIQDFFRNCFTEKLSETAIGRYKLGGDPDGQYEYSIVTFDLHDKDVRRDELRNNLQRIAEEAIQEWVKRKG